MGAGTTKRDKFAEVLESVPEHMAAQLCAELDKLVVKYARRADAINAKDGGNKPYHKGPHSREMSSDAARIRKNARHFFKHKNGSAVDLYVKLVQAIHAAHDIVQGVPAKGENERLSAEDFKKEFNALLKRIDYKNQDSKLFQANVNLFAKKLIIDGTVFDFGSKQQPIVADCLQGKLPKSPLVALGCLHIAINDTSRMFTLPEMLRDPEARFALRTQHDALKDNMLVNILQKGLAKRKKRNAARRNRRIMQGIHEKGMELYLYVRQVKGETQRKQSNEFDSTNSNELLPTLAFMHIFGQNLRANSEFAKNDAGAQLFRTYLDNKTPKLDQANVDAAYDFIIAKMEFDLSDKGFCPGMMWTENGIAQINKTFRAKYHVKFNIFDRTYDRVWREYVSNAKLVLTSVQKHAAKLSDEDKLKFKKRFVVQCLHMARNQNGLFLMQNDLPRKKKRLSV